MPQLFLYVPEPVARELQKRARERGLSLSRYLAELAKREIEQAWPGQFFDEVVGGWQGDSLVRPEQGELEARERLP